MESIEIPYEPEMHRREIKLPDGRYLLFYTFDASEASVRVEPESEEEPDR